MGLKIAIIGKAPSSRHLAPWDDPAWEIWTLSDCFRFAKRITRSFELHPLDVGKTRWPADFWGWLTTAGPHELWIARPHAAFPHAKIFPSGELIDRFGKHLYPTIEAMNNKHQHGLRYFTNTVSWLIAFALHLGAESIGLFGVDMAQFGVAGESEYGHQRPSCEHFVGIAQGLGVDVVIPNECDLFKAGNLYAIETHDEWWMKRYARKQELKNRLAQMDHDMNITKANRNMLAGAIDDMAWHEQAIFAGEAVKK